MNLSNVFKYGITFLAGTFVGSIFMQKTYNKMLAQSMQDPNALIQQLMANAQMNPGGEAIQPMDNSASGQQFNAISGDNPTSTNNVVNLPVTAQRGPIKPLNITANELTKGNLKV